MRRFSIGVIALASLGIVFLFLVWPAVNTRLSYAEEPVYTTPVTIETAPTPVKKPRPSRFVKKGETIALDDYFVAPPGTDHKYHRFYTRFEDVVRIDVEERTATFEQKGVFTICGTLFSTHCEVIIAEEVPTYPR